MSEVSESDLVAALKAEIASLKDQIKALTQRAEQAEALSVLDSLTPVMNRRGFMNQVSRTLAFGRRHRIPAVLIYLDMDGFKQINDSLGHAAGDAALIKVAQFLVSSVRGADTVGRLGGDEFGLILLYAGKAEGEAKAEYICQRLASEPFIYEGYTIPLAGSFGVQELANQQDADQWLAEADAAMWRRKRANR